GEVPHVRLQAPDRARDPRAKGRGVGRRGAQGRRFGLRHGGVRQVRRGRARAEEVTRPDAFVCCHYGGTECVDRSGLCNAKARTRTKTRRAAVPLPSPIAAVSAIPILRRAGEDSASPLSFLRLCAFAPLRLCAFALKSEIVTASSGRARRRSRMPCGLFACR